MPQPPIDSYGLIGNMRTAALVGPRGSIDWLCLPRFDSPSVFGALLDEDRGGRFEVTADGNPVRWRSYYLPDTNVLVTRLVQEGNIGEIFDLMPVSEARHDRPLPELLRLVRVHYGRMEITMRCEPAFDYGRERHAVEVGDGRAFFRSSRYTLGLESSIALQPSGDGAMAQVVLEAGQSAVFALRHDLSRPLPGIDALPLSPEEGEEILHDTVRYWKNWIRRCTYHGRWREQVRRSALALKLMTYQETGAIIAAPTTSLPEHIGGTRNWDYRYVWLRDAAFTMYAFLRIGFHHEAAGFMDFLQKRCHELEPGQILRPLYGIDGRHETPEEMLEHWSGYHGSRPVRIGNGAYEQLQLDITGSLMDAVYLYNKHAAPITHDMWIELREILDWVCKNWDQKDAGIWEVRDKPRHFVYSRLMCWVALDRGLRLAKARGLPAPTERWTRSRDAIYEQIMERGYDPDVGAFVQAYGWKNLDAANLLMPLVYFVSPHEPRMASTIEKMCRPPQEGGLVSDFLVHRYLPHEAQDGLESEPEGAFSICSFWMAEALARDGRMDVQTLDRARLIFERMLTFAGPLGLYSEQISPEGQALGNYPQALTHLALITTAYHLDEFLP
jgi:GH15 family glucan-1,4-alpha-glucosidase